MQNTISVQIKVQIQVQDSHLGASLLKASRPPERLGAQLEGSRCYKVLNTKSGTQHIEYGPPTNTY